MVAQQNMLNQTMLEQQQTAKKQEEERNAGKLQTNLTVLQQELAQLDSTLGVNGGGGQPNYGGGGEQQVNQPRNIPPQQPLVHTQKQQNVTSRALSNSGKAQQKELVTQQETTQQPNMLSNTTC